MHTYKGTACMREQDRKMAEKVAGHAQEQMRKALAARPSRRSKPDAACMRTSAVACAVQPCYLLSGVALHCLLHNNTAAARRAHCSTALSIAFCRQRR